MTKNNNFEVGCQSRFKIELFLKIYLQKLKKKRTYEKVKKNAIYLMH